MKRLHILPPNPFRGFIMFERPAKPRPNQTYPVLDVSPIAPYRTSSVMMNDQKMIDIRPVDKTKTIGTSALAGCLAVVAIVEDYTGTRRCGLAHYDPMSLMLGLGKRRKLDSVVHLFNRSAQLDKDKLVRKAVIVMAVDPGGHQRAFLDAIKTEAKCLLGCDNIVVIKYGDRTPDRLDVSVPNHINGTPSYTTSTMRGNVSW